MSKTLDIALGKYELMHDITAPVKDVTPTEDTEPTLLYVAGPLEDVAPVGDTKFDDELIWLFAWTDFAITAEVLILINRAVRATEDIEWAVKPYLDFGSSFALGFNPDAFRDEDRRTRTLAVFNREFAAQAQRFVDNGGVAYSPPAVAENAEIYNEPAHRR